MQQPPEPRIRKRRSPRRPEDRTLERLLLGGPCFLIAAALFFFGVRAALDDRATASWVETPARIGRHHIESVTHHDDSPPDTSYLPHVRMSYSVRGEHHEGPPCRDEALGSFSTEREAAECPVGALSYGDTTSIWVSPEDPALYSLAPGVISRTTLGLLGAGAVATLLGVWALVSMRQDRRPKAPATQG